MRRFFFVVGVCLLVGCTVVGEEDIFDTFDDVPPEVIDTFPKDGWVQVPTGIEAKIWFSEPVDPTSVHRGSIYLISGQDLAVCGFLVDQEAEQDQVRGLVTLYPLKPLIAGVLYRLAVTTWVTDLYGNPLQNGVEIGFQTLR